MAALTVAVTNLDPRAQAVSLGNLKARLVKVTVNSTGTDAGGASLSAADCGLSEIVLFLGHIDAGDNGSVVGAGFVPQYNYVTGKLQFFQEGANTNDPLEEVDADLTDVQVRALVIGW